MLTLSKLLVLINSSKTPWNLNLLLYKCMGSLHDDWNIAILWDLNTTSLTSLENVSNILTNIILMPKSFEIESGTNFFVPIIVPELFY